LCFVIPLKYLEALETKSLSKTWTFLQIKKNTKMEIFGLNKKTCPWKREVVLAFGYLCNVASPKLEEYKTCPFLFME
jgi:hypothetical protein